MEATGGDEKGRSKAVEAALTFGDGEGDRVGVDAKLGRHVVLERVLRRLVKVLDCEIHARLHARRRGVSQAVEGQAG